MHTRNMPAAGAALLKLLAAWVAGVGAALSAWWEAAVAVPMRRLFPFLDAQHRLAQLRTVRWSPVLSYTEALGLRLTLVFTVPDLDQGPNMSPVPCFEHRYGTMMRDWL